MDNEIVKLPAPNGPCQRCIEHESLSLNDGTVAIFCAHRLSGACYVPAVRAWCIYTPISERAFRVAIGYEAAGEPTTH